MKPKQSKTKIVISWAIMSMILLLLDGVFFGLAIGNYTYNILDGVLKPIQNTPFVPLIMNDLINAAVLLFLLTKTGCSRKDLLRTVTVSGLIGLMHYSSFNLVNYATIPQWNLLLVFINISAGIVVYVLTAVISMFVNDAMNRNPYETSRPTY